MTTQFKLATGVAVEEVGGIAVLTTETGDAAVLNATAYSMLEFVLADFSTASDCMMAKYNVSKDEVFDDLNAFVARLCGLGLLKEII